MTVQDDSTPRSRRGTPQNCRQLLLSLRNLYPRDGQEELRARFRDRVREDDALIDECADKFYSLEYKATIEPASRKGQQTRAEKAKAAHLFEQGMRATKVRATRAVLLDMEIDGKKLRDMTGKECAQKGGWLMRIAHKVKATQKVGDALNEKQVRELYGIPS